MGCFDGNFLLVLNLDKSIRVINVPNNRGGTHRFYIYAMGAAQQLD